MAKKLSKQLQPHPLEVCKKGWSTTGNLNSQEKRIKDLARQLQQSRKRESKKRLSQNERILPSYERKYSNRVAQLDQMMIDVKELKKKHQELDRTIEEFELDVADDHN